jgi:RimJ/RimL family protein N-acetyltransferase
MHELDFGDYGRARPLFHAGPETYTALCFDAAGAGTMPARLWVDDPQAPRTALLWDEHLCFDLAGESGDPAIVAALAALWAHAILPQVRGHGPWCKVRYTLPAWEGALPAIFGPAGLRRRERRLYTFDQMRIPDAERRIPPDFTLAQVDAAFLQQDQLRNHEAVRHEIATCWRSPRAFLEAGQGVCLLQDATVVAWCLGEYASAGRIGIGIETVRPYQGRGLATALAAVFVARCLAGPLAPYWDCWADNQPSWAVAERVGFRLAQAYPAHLVTFAAPVAT